MTHPFPSQNTLQKLIFIIRGFVFRCRKDSKKILSEEKDLNIIMLESQFRKRLNIL
jgi:hypothetical protein